MDALAFYIFAGISLISAIGIVVTRNIVRAATCLLGTLGGVAGLYFLLNANLLAAIQLIVYAGGTLILIVFGVMLTSKSPWVLFEPTRKQIVGGVVVALLLALGLGTMILNTYWPVPAGEMTASPQVKAVGTMLLTDYLVPFEAASVLLLVVMIGAAYLARPEKSMQIGLNHYLILAVAIFSLGILCMVTKRNALGILIGVELVLNAANINLVAFSRYQTGAGDGHVFAVFVILLAAAEAAIGIAIFMNFYNTLQTIDVDRGDELRH